MASLSTDAVAVGVAVVGVADAMAASSGMRSCEDALEELPRGGQSRRSVGRRRTEGLVRSCVLLGDPLHGEPGGELDEARSVGIGGGVLDGRRDHRLGQLAVGGSERGVQSLAERGQPLASLGDGVGGVRQLEQRDEDRLDPVERGSTERGELRGV